MSTLQADVAVVGAGIVGLATAHELLRRAPGLSLVILEKEPAPAAHQTGHNSGVLHSGIYYKPGSKKARNCREGKALMEAFCEAEGVPFDICGKVIVAVDESELPALEAIHERGLANGVDCRRISADELRELEPHSAGIAALHVPEAGIVSYPKVVEKLVKRIESAGGNLHLGSAVRDYAVDGERVRLSTEKGDFDAKCVVNCGGLQSDRLTKLSGQEPPARIVPFRGEYYQLKPDALHLCRNLIYPVPDPNFPFLGVHFTRMIDGHVECGPNAVLALAREGYSWGRINLRDLAGTLTYSGFWRLVMKHWKAGMGEMHRSLSKGAFTKALQRLMPDIRAEHLDPAPAGVRAQALLPTGGMVDDFLIVEEGPIVNVCNAPSPAATSSLAIGRTIVQQLESRLSLDPA